MWRMDSNLRLQWVDSLSTSVSLCQMISIKLQSSVELFVKEITN